MRLPNLVTLSIGALLVASLSGCVTDELAPPQPTATFVAPYASDEEALAAAEEAYEEYLRVSDTILNEGGVSAERILEVTSGEFADISVEGFEAIAAEGRRSVGNAKFDSMSLQRYSVSGGNKEIISVYLCHDVTDVDLLDSAGTSLVPPDRRDRVRFEASFDFDVERQHLVISHRAVWTDPDC
ncbi:hypothetical protein I6E74_06985 [Salinibacterium sp. SWN139]|uniref:hypothetical protein n=1 Tax=Salinibacterium sp. SWN139 TaxID=2792055 RepID=UPI0018CCFD14|nr:hypothetical protein [Salinibacterium sp. SWN139]MBH0053912.1 hypothetical protein [Salinibacterium sp. SWN139]